MDTISTTIYIDDNRTWGTYGYIEDFDYCQCQDRCKQCKKLIGPNFKPIDYIKEYKIIADNQTEICQIEEYFKQHPDQKSVMLACFCSRCSPRC